MRVRVAASVEAVADDSLIDRRKIRFRPLNLCDLPLMYVWLNRDFVSRWYGGGDRTYEEIAAKYEPRILGNSPADPYLMLYDDLPIGYIQAYRIVDYPYLNRFVKASPNAVGVDLFIGERDYLHVGFGPAMLDLFLDRVIFDDLTAAQCIVAPDARNRAAIRCYEKVGFEFWKSVRVPGRPRSLHLMRIGREVYSPLIRD